jgi:hypothetical protein
VQLYRYAGGNYKVISIHHNNQFLCVSQSVLTSSPSKTHDQIFVVVKTVVVLFVKGRSSLSRGWVSLVTGHSPCLCQVIYMYIHFDCLLTFITFSKFFMYRMSMYVFPSPSLHIHYLVVGIVSKLRAGRQGFRFPAGAGNFSFHHRVQTGSGAHPASYSMGMWDFFPGGKAVGVWR